MIKKYICFLKKNNNVQTLTFSINENPLTEAWSSTIEASLNEGFNKIVGMQNTFLTEATSETITEPIDKIVKILEKYNPIFINSWPPTTTDITTALNDLHYKFQTTEEKLKTLPPVDNEYHYNLHLLNVKIHEAEHIVKNQKRKVVWYINQSLKDSVEITDELRKYWGVSFAKYNPARQLYLGYHTIGKDLFTCFADNDIELIKTGGLRQQQHISTETVFRFNPILTVNRNFLIKKWLRKNGVDHLVDLSDPQYKYNHQPPVLGKLKNKLTDEEIINIWKNWEFFKVDAE
jgi:hypothetical protein